MHGQFAWYDLLTPDIAAARTFYAAVTGWGTQPWKPAGGGVGGEYTMWTVGGGGTPFAGVMRMPSEQIALGIQPHWLAHVAVDSVDDSARKAGSLGGKVLHGPEDIPDVGRFAIVQDPQGGMTSIFAARGGWSGWDGTPEIGRFSWHELMTTDVAAAFRFYSGLFGWKKTGEFDMGPHGKYLMYGLRGRMFGGIFARRPEHGTMGPNWTFYVNVPELDRAVAAASSRGGRVKQGPMDVPGGDRVAVLADSQGAIFALHEVARSKKTLASPRRKSSAKGARRKSTAKAARRKVAAKRAGKRAAPRPSARGKTRPTRRKASPRRGRR